MLIDLSNALGGYFYDVFWSVSTGGLAASASSPGLFSPRASWCMDRLRKRRRSVMPIRLLGLSIGGACAHGHAALPPRPGLHPRPGPSEFCLRAQSYSSYVDRRSNLRRRVGLCGGFQLNGQGSQSGVICLAVTSDPTPGLTSDRILTAALLKRLKLYPNQTPMRGPPL